MSQIPFSKGDRVEILRASSLSPLLPRGLRSGGALYPATVLRAPARTRAQILVEYDGVTSPTSPMRLREYVPWATARPAPPRELGRRFRVGEEVEAYADEGWHQGFVLEISEDGPRYLVFLEGPESEVEFPQSDLRLRREWTEGGWAPPFPGQQFLQNQSPAIDPKHGEVRPLKTAIRKTKSAPLFRKGKTVEVRSDEQGYEGSWYTAVVKDYLGDENYRVQYLTLVTDDETGPLTEVVRGDHLRPYPPRKAVVPRPLDKVDVWYNDGWWEGFVSKAVNESVFVVYFSTTNEEIMFRQSELRIHQDWIDRKWVVASPDSLIHLGPSIDNLNSETGSNNCLSSGLSFRKGMKVEVRGHEAGYLGSWYAAVIAGSVGEDKYLVEYQTLKTDDGTELLREETRASDIRPRPPDVQRVYRFSRLEEVDTWYNDGWWTGHVSQILEDSSYQVYFRLSNEEMVFKHSELRPHQEWFGGQWIPSSKDHITV